MEAEEEDFPRTIILGNPEKNSKIKVQWADDSFRVGSGFGVQSSTKLVSLLDKQRSSTEEPPVQQFSLVDKQNTEDKNSIENSPKTRELATNEYYDDMLNVIPNQTLKSEYLETEHPVQNEDVKPAIQSLECRNLNEDDKLVESKAEGDVCNSLQSHRTSNQSANRNDSTEAYSSDKRESKLTEGKTQCWISILKKPSSTILPGNLSTSTSNATSNPEATLDKMGASFIMNSDTKVLDKLDKTKAWTSILKKPSKDSSLVANSPTSTSNDTCNSAATVNKKDRALPALSIDENLASLVSLTDECHNKLFPLLKKQTEACIPNMPKVDPSVKSIVPMASATEKKLAEEKKVYSVSLLNQTSSFNKSHSAFQENFKQANDSAENQSISKHGASHKTLVSLLNGKTFPMSVPLKNVQEGYSTTSEMHVKSPTNDFYSHTKRKSEQIDTSLGEAFGKECIPSEAMKRRKTDKQHASKSDDGESFNVFIDPNFDTAYKNEETSYDNEIKKELHDSDFYTFDSDTSRLDTENNSGSEATTSLFIKQETLDPEYGDEPSVSTDDVKNPVPIISTMDIPIKEEASSEDGHLFNKNGCDAEDSEDKNISFVKQELFDPEYEDTPPDLSLNASSMSQESTDLENEDIPPVLSPKKEADDSEFEEWNEDCEDSPPVLQKEDNLSKEDTSPKIPKRITKSRVRKQVRNRGKNVINDKFMCPICKAVFEKIEDFDVHKALHSGQQILSDKQYPEKFVIKPSTIRQDGNRKFKCEYCGKAFNRPSNLKEHTRIHTGMYPHRCQLCDKGFHTRSRFLAHMARHDEIKETKEAQDIVLKYTKDGPTNEEMEIQEFSDMKLRKYVCNICNEIFDKVTLYRIHRLKHRGEIPHTCNSCGKAFPCKSDLVRHEATHSDERPYKCHICFKSFKRRNALVDHLTIHKREESNESGEKDSVDSIMKTLEPSIESIVQSLEPNSSSPGKSATETEKEFENFKEMERPIYTDDGQKIINSKFYCKECKISFSARREYSMHRFQHNGGHPHVCEVCNKVYPYKSDYDRHVATHLGRKPYVCHLCNCEFSRKHYLQKHLLMHKNTRISLGGMSKSGYDFQIEIDNPEKSASEVSDCEDNGDVDLRTTAGKLETSYDEDGAMFLFVTDD